MKKAKLLMVIFLVCFGVLLSSNAMAISVEWQTVDWRAWGRLYSAAGVPLPPLGNPFDGSTTQVLPPGVYMGPDGSEDAFGVTQILNIKDAGTSAVLWEKSAAEELTVFFWGADDVMLTPFAPGFAELITLGFRAEIWLDATPDYDFTLGPGGRDIVGDPTHFHTVTDDGVMVLSLMGHALAYGGDPTKLYDAREIGDASTGAFNGSIFLDVTGGTWASYYDTDTFAPINSATGGTADFNMSFSTLPNSAHSWMISGNATAQADLVPEPATIGLMGMGLIGLAWVSRKRFLKK